MDKITGTVQGVGIVTGKITQQGTIRGKVILPEIISPGTYKGEYQITPTQDTQTIPTKDLLLSDDIVINPIPNNYGLITWNGSTLTVS